MFGINKLESLRYRMALFALCKV